MLECVFGLVVIDCCELLPLEDGRSTNDDTEVDSIKVADTTNQRTTTFETRCMVNRFTSDNNLLNQLYER